MEAFVFERKSLDVHADRCLGSTRQSEIEVAASRLPLLFREELSPRGDLPHTQRKLNAHLTH
jgi:hypothetical protein